MSKANPGFIYCPRLSYWRPSTIKRSVCPTCQYLGCPEAFKHMVGYEELPTQLVRSSEGWPIKKNE